MAGPFQPKDDTVGECRVNPPTYNPSTIASRAPDKRGVWPETYGGDWCGQFSLHRWPQTGSILRPPPLN